MSAPRISVVIPVYNQEKYIEQTVLSALNQEGADFEVIAVNDGSIDRSGEILKKYAERVTIISQENQGVAEARNAGVRKAGSGLIAFLDGDDCFCPGHLANAVQFASAHPAAILFYGDADLIDEKGGRIGLQKSEPDADLTKLLLGNFVIASSAAVRKKLFEQGEWFEAFHPAEDWDLWLRAIKLGAFVHYPWIGAEYRKHPASAIKSKALLAEQMELKVLDRAFERNPGLPQILKNQALSNEHYQSLLRFLSAGGSKEARERARMCLKKNPAMSKAWLGFCASLAPHKILQMAVDFRTQMRKWLS